jgi:hypothetical protein
MINTLKSSLVVSAASLWRQEDPSLYGTLLVVVACLGTVGTVLLLG